MTSLRSAIAIAATAALLSGPALAAAPQPAAGAQPLFNGVATTSASTLQRAAVRADAIAHAPAAGEMNLQAPQAAGTLTRAQVREATLQALRRGFHVRTGDAS